MGDSYTLVFWADLNADASKKFRETLNALADHKPIKTKLNWADDNGAETPECEEYNAMFDLWSMDNDIVRLVSQHSGSGSLDDAKADRETFFKELEDAGFKTDDVICELIVFAEHRPKRPRTDDVSGEPEAKKHKA